MQRLIALTSDQIFNVWADARANGRASGEDVDQWSADDMMWWMDSSAVGLFNVHDFATANRAEVGSALGGGESFFLNG